MLASFALSRRHVGDLTHARVLAEMWRAAVMAKGLTELPTRNGGKSRVVTDPGLPLQPPRRTVLTTSDVEWRPQYTQRAEHWSLIA